MSEASPADWLAAFSALMAALAGLAAFWVSYQQLRAARRQTLANLFEARFKVYRDLCDVLGRLKQYATLRREPELDLCREAYHLGAVLFDSSLEPSLQRVFNLASSIANAQARREEAIRCGDSRDDLSSQIDNDRAKLEPLLESVVALLKRDVTSWRG